MLIEADLPLYCKCFMCDVFFTGNDRYYECLKHIAVDHLTKNQIRTCWCDPELCYTPHGWMKHVLGLSPGSSIHQFNYRECYDAAIKHYADCLTGKIEEKSCQE